MQSKQVKGFTLIELLIVIGIIAILATVVILTLNPAELLRQARDSTRISDLGTLKSAISLYLADYATPSLGNATQCYTSIATGYMIATGTGAISCGTNLPATGVGRFPAVNYFSVVSASGSITTARNVNGAGWIPVDLTQIGSGAPISAMPMDPIVLSGGGNASATGYFYAYAVSSSRGIGSPLLFEVNAQLESAKYGFGGGSDAASTDGGNSTGTFEVGTFPSLQL